MFGVAHGGPIEGTADETTRADDAKSDFVALVPDHSAATF
jgi:hypothetical protein